jgi:hypothetical protein
MSEVAIQELAKSGPWAVVSGLLLWTIIKAWNKDREQVTELLRDFRQSIEKLTVEIHRLGEIQSSVITKNNEHGNR